MNFKKGDIIQMKGKPEFTGRVVSSDEFGYQVKVTTAKPGQLAYEGLFTIPIDKAEQGQQNLPQDLTTITEVQRQEILSFLMSLPLRTLRQRQDLVAKQIRVAFRQENDTALDNLRIKETLLTEAVLQVAF